MGIRAFLHAGVSVVSCAHKPFDRCPARGDPIESQRERAVGAGIVMGDRVRRPDLPTSPTDMTASRIEAAETLTTPGAVRRRGSGTALQN